MSIAELKEKIIAKIVATNDDELLEHIADVIDLYSTEIYEMSPGEIEAVMKGWSKLGMVNGYHRRKRISRLMNG